MSIEVLLRVIHDLQLKVMQLEASLQEASEKPEKAAE